MNGPGDTHRFIIRFTSANLRVISVVDGMDTSHRPSKVRVAVNGLPNDVYLDDVLQQTMCGISEDEMAAAHSGVAKSRRVEGRIGLDTKESLATEEVPYVVAGASYGRLARPLIDGTRCAKAVYEGTLRGAI